MLLVGGSGLEGLGCRFSIKGRTWWALVPPRGAEWVAGGSRGQAVTRRLGLGVRSGQRQCKGTVRFKGLFSL